MRTPEEVWPLFGLTVRCGPLEMRPVRDEDLPAALQLAEAGVHAPDEMPFYVPWTDATGDELAHRMAQHHWRQRAELTPQRWGLELAVRYDGELVGMQGVGTEDFLVTRTGETGSWLGVRFHRRGIGTLMRQAFCAFCFDHLSFTEITSGAFSDNPASLGVSRKVGYVANGARRLVRREVQAEVRCLVLTPEALVRPAYPVEVEGVDGVRRLLGLEAL